MRPVGVAFLVVLLSSAGALAVEKKDRIGSSEGVGGCEITFVTTWTASGKRHTEIKRSASEVAKFKRLTGYPNGRKGHVVDHIKALKHHGCDVVENMQWQTVAEAKAKDKWE